MQVLPLARATAALLPIDPKGYTGLDAGLQRRSRQFVADRGDTAVLHFAPAPRLSFLA